jgi:hypothetical protein
MMTSDCFSVVVMNRRRSLNVFILGRRAACAL